MQLIDQTIFHDDPIRPGNCVAACVATALKMELKDVPHFVEWGQVMHNGLQKSEDNPDTQIWWGMFLGFLFANELIPEVLDSLDESPLDEIVFVAGKSPRGVMHQVLYKNGKLFHDPHPSRGGVTNIVECFVLVPMPRAGHDHDPTSKMEALKFSQAPKQQGCHNEQS